VKVINYKWSKTFDISAVGLSGAIELSRNTKQVEGEDELTTSHTCLDFGVMI
jgi:hypothetical protein